MTNDATSDPAGDANRRQTQPLPPPEEIVPARTARGALYRLRTPMTSDALPWIMPYAFLGSTPDEGVTLYDSGFGTREAREALTSQLAALGRRPADVARLIVSHAHPDHIGMAGWLRSQSPDMELVMHRREASWYASMGRTDRWESDMRGWAARHGFDPDEMERAQRQFDERRQRELLVRERDAASETHRRTATMERVAPTREVEDGEEIAFDGWRLTSIFTPGHTPGHLCIHIPDEQLTMTGDHVLSRITPNVSSWAEEDDEDRNPLREYLASLAYIASLPTRLALPAHEDLIEDLPARCAVITEHHHERADEVLAGIASHEGGTTAFDVASGVTWNKPWETFSVWKRRSAVGETLAHLRLLEDEGRVRRVVSDDSVRWLRVP